VPKRGSLSSRLPDLGPEDFEAPAALAVRKRERDKPGRRPRHRLPVGGMGEARVPPVDVIRKVVVEDTGTDLEREVGSPGLQRICRFFTIRLLTTG